MNKTSHEIHAWIESLKKRQEAEHDALPDEEKQRREMAERQKQEAEEREALLSFYAEKGIPPRYYDATWDNWLADTEPKQKALALVREAWNTNLFLCGKNGTGKTHLAMCLAKDGAVYRRFPDIFREARSNPTKEQSVINHYGSAKLLIIDEIGRQKLSGFEKNLLSNLFFEIIDKRWNNMLPTTLITNLSDKEFSKEYGMAVLDRLRPRKVSFNWESHRKSLTSNFYDKDIDF